MPDETEDWKWLGDKVWLDLLEPMLFEDSALADQAAKLWHYLLLEIESGPDGVTNAAVCLENALRLTFPFTTTYQACMILFQESLVKLKALSRSTLESIRCLVNTAEPMPCF